MNRTIRFGKLFALCVACTLAGSANAQQPSKAKHVGPFEHGSVAQAWKVAKKSRQPLLLFVTSDNCVYCHKMADEVYSHPKLRPAISKLFESAQMNVKENPAFVKKLGVRLYPTTVIISPDGKHLGSIEGYVEPRKIAARLNPALKAHKDNESRRAVAAVRARSAERSDAK